MNFLELLDGAEYLAQQGDPTITGLDYDSRRVKPGWCFVAMRGETTDGNRHIDAALAGGAVAVVSDSSPPRPGVPWAQVPHGRRALARLQRQFLPTPGGEASHHRHHRDQRQDHDLIPAARHAARQWPHRPRWSGTVEYRIGDEICACAAHHSRSVWS